MKRIAPHKIEEIFAAADIVDVVGEFVELKKRGTNFFGLSPFVNEKTPSFAVSPNKNIFKDFSSGKGGNAVTFLMEAEGMSYVEALKWLADRYNIELELEETADDLMVRDRRESLFVVNEFAARWFHTQLMKTDDGRRIGLSYFKERGILETTIEEFQLGYSPEKWDAFATEAKQQQFDQEFLVETGLCFTSEKDGSLLDRYRGRVMFPITDHLGKTVGFGGRILDKTKKAAKYVNSPESEIYHKSRVLYGLHQAKQQIRDLDFAILVEGYMDVISLFQAGIRNAVASSGTALTEDQIKLLKRFSPNVLLIYDADNAGINAALRGADLMLEQELTVRVLLLPEGHDPDSFVQEKGKTGFDDYREAWAVDFVEFKIQYLLRELSLSDPGQKTEIIHQTASTIAKIPDMVKQAVYVAMAAERLNIGTEVMDRAVQKSQSEKMRLAQRSERFRDERAAAQVQQQQVVAPIEEVAPLRSPTWEQEKEILRLMLNYPDKVLALEDGEITLPELFIGDLEDFEFGDALAERFKQELFNQYIQTGKIDLHHFLNHEDVKLSKMARDMVTIPYEVSENWEKYEIRAPKVDENLEEAAFSVLMHYNRVRINKLLEDSRKAIRDNRDPEKEDELLKRHIALENTRLRLNTEIGTEGGIDPRLII